MTLKPISLDDARWEAALSISRRAGGYCAMPHPTEPGSCGKYPGHERSDDPANHHHRDWHRRLTPLGPYLDWDDDEYA
ncbi:hypothetical protein [Streptomyces chilikensis]|uniref:hypothetical protein n=1 Tax=Streptomyces chilikensis TaxID=1194079 RepID=UPI000B31FF2D|nr:hypothetical protein [Streptomyces chilikensis]